MILIFSTQRWPNAARFAMRFAAHGVRVEVLLPVGHPAEQVRCVSACHAYNKFQPLRSLLATLQALRPAFVLPCDDQAARLLVALAGAAIPVDLRTQRLIRHSLGNPAAVDVLGDFDSLQALAARLGVRMVPGHLVDDLASLHRLQAAAFDYPVVLKEERTWGGLGVVVCHSAQEMDAAWHQLRGGWSLRKSLWRATVERDVHPLLAYAARHLGGRPPRIVLQRHVVGIPANLAVSAWRGQVLAQLPVRALQTQRPTGPATVIEEVDSAEMSSCGRRMTRDQALSGLWGFDFMIERGSGDAWLIEVNPRATPSCALGVGRAASLIGRLALFLRLPEARAQDALAALSGQDGPPAFPSRAVALFPGEWQRDAASPWLAEAYHDVPWSEPALVRELVGLPYAGRGLVARLRACVLRVGAYRADPDAAAAAGVDPPAPPPCCSPRYSSSGPTSGGPP